jgi:hypothetical protein
MLFLNEGMDSVAIQSLLPSFLASSSRPKGMTGDAIVWFLGGLLVPWAES